MWVNIMAKKGGKSRHVVGEEASKETVKGTRRTAGCSGNETSTVRGERSERERIPGQAKMLGSNREGR